MTKTKKPIITLKSISVHEGLSQETPAYTATIYVDGKAFCKVSNAGHGGGDEYAPLKRGQVSCIAGVAELNERIGETYPIDREYGMRETLECLCHGIVWKHADQRRFKRLLSRKVLMIEGGKCLEVNVKPTPEIIARVKSKFPKAEILNGMDAATVVEKVGALS